MNTFNAFYVVNKISFSSENATYDTPFYPKIEIERLKHFLLLHPFRYFSK